MPYVKVLLTMPQVYLAVLDEIAETLSGEFEQPNRSKAVRSLLDPYMPRPEGKPKRKRKKSESDG